MKFNLDCKHFKGEVPCGFRESCLDCPDYLPMGKRILIIKLKAPGDVLRTTPILRGLKRRYPQSHISWVTEKEALDLLKDNPLIDRLLVFCLDTVMRLEIEKFDLVLSLDKDPRAAALACALKARMRFGFGLNSTGNIFPLNKESEYAFQLGLSNYLKFKVNIKTYQELIFQMCKLKYKREEYIFKLSNEDMDYAKRFLKKLGLKEGKFLIGLNTGAGEVFANKAWTIPGYIKLIKLISKKTKAKILLLGGPKEVQRNRSIKSQAGKQILDAGCNHSILQFAGIINCCDLIVTADTTALHLAIALSKPVVAIFGPTCPQEIELYSRGQKVISKIDCAPCYKRSCSKRINCMTTISAQQVYEAVSSLIPEKT